MGVHSCTALVGGTRRQSDGRERRSGRGTRSLEVYLGWHGLPGGSPEAVERCFLGEADPALDVGLDPLG